MIRGGMKKKHLPENGLYYPLETAKLVTFTEEIVNRKLHFFCSVEIATGDWREIMAIAKNQSGRV